MPRYMRVCALLLLALGSSVVFRAGPAVAAGEHDLVPIVPSLQHLARHYRHERANCPHRWRRGGAMRQSFSRQELLWQRYGLRWALANGAMSPPISLQGTRRGLLPGEQPVCKVLVDFNTPTKQQQNKQDRLQRARLLNLQQQAAPRKSSDNDTAGSLMLPGLAGSAGLPSDPLGDRVSRSEQHRRTWKRR